MPTKPTYEELEQRVLELEQRVSEYQQIAATMKENRKLERTLRESQQR